MVGSAVNDSLDTILAKIDPEISKLFEDRNVLLTDGGLITFTGTQIQFTENLNIVFNSKVAGGSPTVISLGSGTQTLANGDIWYATVNRTGGTAVTAVASSLPAVTSANQEIFLLAKRVDAGDGTQRIYWRSGMAMSAGQTLRLGAASSGSGSGTGDDLDALTFRASFNDPFDDGPTATLSAVNASAGFTDSTAYSAAKSLYQLNYDASKTIAAGTTTTTINISANASFTVKTGDMVIYGTQARRITAVSTQSSFTTEAFTSAPTLAGQVTISQAVYTKDIYNLVVDGAALSEAFGASTFSEIMVDYEDTSTVGDNIFNPNIAPVIAFSASQNNVAFSDLAVRPTNETDEVESYFLPAADAALYIRFFANKTSGSGSVNIIRYKAFMQKSAVASSGGLLNAAYAFTDGVGTPVNCSVAVVGGKTTITLTGGFQYAVGVNSGGPYGGVEVYLNGQLLPRFIDSTLTPDGSFLETSPTVITLDKNYSALNFSVEILQRLQIVDTSDQNTTSIATINTHRFRNQIINSNFDFWQRNTSFTTPASGSYTSDRWRIGYDGTIGTFTVSRQAFTVGQTDVPNEPTYFFRWNHTAAGSGSTERAVSQRIESVRTLAGKYAVVSFYMKADTSRNVNVFLNQSFGTGGSPSSSVVTATQTVSLTTNWQQFVLVFNIANISGKTLGTNNNDFLELVYDLPVNTTMTIDLAQSMVNEGTAIAPYIYASGGSSPLLEAELALCQRYYEKSYNLDVNPGAVSNPGLASGAIASNIGGFSWPFKVFKRASPTVTVYSNVTGTSGQLRNITTGADAAATVNIVGMNSTEITSGGTGGNGVRFQYTADSEL